MTSGPSGAVSAIVARAESLQVFVFLSTFYNRCSP